MKNLIKIRTFIFGYRLIFSEKVHEKFCPSYSYLPQKRIGFKLVNLTENNCENWEEAEDYIKDDMVNIKLKKLLVFRPRNKKIDCPNCHGSGKIKI